MNLLALNTHRVGFAGLVMGGASIIAALASLIHLLSTPSYLFALYWAIIHGSTRSLTNPDIMAFCELAACVIALVGAFVISLLAAYFGMPAPVDSGKP